MLLNKDPAQTTFSSSKYFITLNHLKPQAFPPVSPWKRQDARNSETNPRWEPSPETIWSKIHSL